MNLMTKTNARLVRGSQHDLLESDMSGAGTSSSVISRATSTLLILERGAKARECETLVVNGRLGDAARRRFGKFDPLLATTSCCG